MSGLIHIYCGDGKGKTTAAIGLAVRCAGSGRRVLLLQFSRTAGAPEFTALEHVPGIEVVPQTRSFGFSWTLSPAEKEEARTYYAGLLEEAFAGPGTLTCWCWTRPPPCWTPSAGRTCCTPLRR